MDLCSTLTHNFGKPGNFYGNFLLFLAIYNVTDLGNGFFEIEFIAAKCVFVKASANNIYVTDLGNGFVLDTDTQFWKTR